MIPDELRTILLSPIRKSRVGQDGRGFSHVEAYEIRAHLIRLFDFDGWDSEVLDMQEIYETEKDGKWTVAYRARVRLKVCWPEGADSYGSYSVFSEWATGEAKNQPSRGDAHDLAIKTAESQALKRCAVNLGDQYGLSLYKRGSTDPLVGKTWHSAAKASATPPTVDEHVKESVPESEQAPAPVDRSVQSQPPKQVSEEDGRALRIADLTAQLLAARTKADVARIAIAISQEGLGGALTDDGKGNALTLGALGDARLKSVHRGAA